MKKLTGSGFYKRTDTGWCLFGISSKPSNDDSLKQIDAVTLEVVSYFLLADSLSSAIVNTIAFRLSNTDVYCKFYTSSYDLYTCEVFDIRPNLIAVFSVGGFNDKGKPDSHVEAFDFRNIQMKYLPNGFGDVFPKLIRFEVLHAKLKRVNRMNFGRMKNLKVLRVPFNELQRIPEDTFHDLLNLEEIDLMSNSLDELPSKLLANLTRLTSFDARHNEISSLAKDFFESTPNIRFIEMSNNPLKTILPMFSELKALWGLYFKSRSCIDDSLLLLKESNETRLMKLNEFDHRVQSKCPVKMN